jgi:hypothetical protein
VTPRVLLISAAAFAGACLGVRLGVLAAWKREMRSRGLQTR